MDHVWKFSFLIWKNRIVLPLVHSIVSADIESQVPFIFTSFSMMKSFCNISNSILILIILDLESSRSIILPLINDYLRLLYCTPNLPLIQERTFLIILLFLKAFHEGLCLKVFGNGVNYTKQIILIHMHDSSSRLLRSD